MARGIRKRWMSREEAAELTALMSVIERSLNEEAAYFRIGRGSRVFKKTVEYHYKFVAVNSASGGEPVDQKKYEGREVLDLLDEYARTSALYRGSSYLVLYVGLLKGKIEAFRGASEGPRAVTHDSSPSRAST